MTAVTTAERTCASPSCTASLEGKSPRAVYCTRRCKNREADRRRFEDDPEAERARKREVKRRRLASPEGRERDREQARRRRAASAENERQRRRSWREANPDKAREMALTASARRRGFTIVDRFDPHAVFQRDRWTCGICGQAIDPRAAYPDRDSATVDHVFPAKRGGMHALSNVQAAHLGCNARKSDRVESGQLAPPFRRSGSPLGEEVF